MSISNNHFWSIELGETLPNLFSEDSNTLVPKTNKQTHKQKLKRKKKLHTSLSHEYRTKIFSERLTNQIQQRIKTVIKRYRDGFIPGTQNWFIM